MKALAIALLHFGVLFSPLLVFSQNGNFCLASQLRQEWWAQHPAHYAQWLEQNQQIAYWLKEHPSPPARGQLLTIPVVVHIIWNAPEENLSDVEVISQIEALNRDFRALNDEIQNIPLLFQPFIADVEVEFCLASADPNGQATNGITRTYTNNDVGIGGTPAIHHTALGGHDAWDPSRYLNIWVAKFAGGVSGTASFPGQGPPEEDGVEINYRYFGTLSAEPPYNLGRTLTHEVGHYLNLEHPWGPQVTDCCADDFVADTPEACETYLGQCPVHPVISCDEPDMFMNYMFYTDDACMGMFSLGQKARMLAALNLLRPGLINAGSCSTTTAEPGKPQPLTVYPNPVNDLLHIKSGAGLQGSVTLTIFDILGRPVWQGVRPAGQITCYVQTLPAGHYLLLLRNKNKLLSAYFFKG